MNTAGAIFVAALIAAAPASAEDEEPVKLSPEVQALCAKVGCVFMTMPALQKVKQEEFERGKKACLNAA